MKIDFVMRSDAASKAGGDLRQFEAYQAALRAHDVDARLVPFSRPLDLRTGALAHLANVARPYDLLSATRDLAGRPFVVSPIHHGLVDLARLRSGCRETGPRAAFERHVDEATREFAATVARGVRAPASQLARLPSLARDWMGLWGRVGDALDSAAAVCLLSRTEGEKLRADTGWAGNNAWVIPNGRPPVGKVRAWSERPIPLIVVGRVEPLKRQLEVAEAAVALSIPVTFVGRLNPRSQRYCDQFRRAVDGSELLTYLGELPAERTLEEIGRSRVLVNASWVEVQSLVDIEAISSGCAVVTSTTGSTAEYFPEVEVFAHERLSDMLSFARELASAATGPTHTAYEHTWASAASTLVEVYRSATR